MANYIVNAHYRVNIGTNWDLPFSLNRAQLIDIGKFLVHNANSEEEAIENLLFSDQFDQAPCARPVLTAGLLSP